MTISTKVAAVASTEDDSILGVDPALPLAAGIAGGGHLGGKALTKNMLTQELSPDSPVIPEEAKRVAKLYKSVPQSAYKDIIRRNTKPKWFNHDPMWGGRAGPYYSPDSTQNPISKRWGAGSYIYSPAGASAETMAHELGHSLQSNLSLWAKEKAESILHKTRGPNTLIGLGSYLGHDSNKEISDPILYGSGALGALSAGTTLGNEIGASVRGYNLMRRAGQNPNIARLFGGNATYALGGAAMQGIPITLAIKRYLSNRKEKEKLLAQEKEASMPNSSTLDQALNLISDFQQKKNEARTDLMESILPEVLQLEESKLAAAPMKEEASKTLHAPKYDRRMKFNTALERSGHKATSEEPAQAKEDPAWLKEAAEEVLAPEADKPKLHPAALSALLGSMGAAQGSFYSGDLKKKLLAGGLGALGGVGIGALANRFVDKEDTEVPALVKNVPTALVGGGLLGTGFGSTARWLEQEHPKAFKRMPLAVGGGALGILGLKKLWDMKHDKQASDPAFDFAGVTGREGVVTVEDELERTPPLPLEEPMSYDVANKPVMQKESAIDLPVDSGIFSVAEPTAPEKALPIVGGLSAGILPLTGAFFNPNPSLKSLGVAGLASAGFGLGTYGLLRHRQNKHREQAQKFVDRLNAVARSPMENFARTEIEKANKTAAYPDDTETFTQRNPWVLPVGVGLLGAAAGAIPAGLLGGRHAVKMIQKMHGSRRGVLEQELADAVRKSRNANKNWNLTQREFNDIKRMVPKKREALKNLEAPNLGMHETLGRAAGGILGGLTGGSLGVLGGLAANKPQPWEQ